MRAGINIVAFVGSSYRFSKTDCTDDKLKCKKCDLAEEKLQKEKGKLKKGKMKQLDLINGCVKRMKQNHILTKFMKQCLSTIEHLLNE